ncbi:uncharacterized protein LOC113290764 [Papaver somniferum]|uniref:uncharacterized protein LOC113290764 n=1 Tax=Papaver somniferum TaxID=3469 RepID=UPI000E6F6560|nr:uncharacterized protein LOC113290764 [Papaver somniferum]
MGEDAAEPPTVEKLIEVQIGDGKHKKTFVGADLPAHERDGLITLLRANVDVFAWSFAEMPGTDPNVACHRLNIDEKFHPVRQKIRNMAQRKKDGVTAEVEKLLEAGFIRQCSIPAVCLMPYPFQRRMEDQEHTAFVTDRGVYCYTVMPIGLKNAGETYQHLVDHMFKDLIGKTMEVYINDMVVKSEQKESHFLDLQKTFNILRQYRMKLNPAKCSYGLSSGKFLGYLMTHRGIKANPEQIRAIREMSSPRTKKEVQKLAGRLVALNCFISRSSDRFKPFFDVLKKAVNFGWTDECGKDFDEIKQYLSTPPVLPVYFVSKSLTGAETRYKKIEKIALALLHASRRLKPYFQGRKIIVYSEYPLKRILERVDDSTRLAIWSNFLGAYEIKYENINAEKGHALAALLAYFDVDDIETVGGGEEELFKVIESATDQTGGSRIEKATRLGFQASNNEAGYEAAIIGLKAVKQLDAKNVKLFFIGQRPQLENRHADALAYLYSAVDTDTTRFVVVDFQELPSISDSQLFWLSNTLVGGGGGGRETISAQGDTENIDNNMDVDSPVIDDSSNPAENTSDLRQPYVRFGILNEIVSDNGKQFDSGVIKDFCKNLNIRHNFSSPYYAQSNRQAKATNRVIMDNLKKRLEKAKGKWIKEFPGVLWSYRTTPKRSTGFSPFTLAYGAEVVIPTEVHLKITKTRAVKSGKNDSILA